MRKLSPQELVELKLLIERAIQSDQLVFQESFALVKSLETSLEWKNLEAPILTISGYKDR